jgi:hypothetical protein
MVGSHAPCSESHLITLNVSIHSMWRACGGLRAEDATDQMVQSVRRAPQNISGGHSQYTALALVWLWRTRAQPGSGTVS